MIDSGKAFSGNERNCVFLNTRDGRFADISAGSGLDFPDDGRAIAVTDWDQDGDLDLWISNRNRSEEHTSELQSRRNLVCRLLLEKKKKHPPQSLHPTLHH